LTGNSDPAEAGLLNPDCRAVQIARALSSTLGMREALTAYLVAVTAVAESDASTARAAAIDGDLRIFMITPGRNFTDF
jgi:hypothetical protein